MDLSCLLRSPTVTSLPTSPFSSRVDSTDKPFLHGKSLKLSRFSNYSDSRKLSRVLSLRAEASGTYKTSSVGVDAIPNKAAKDENLVFVAGATGRVGSRTVRELLKLGFRVRAAARSGQKAENLVQSVRQMKFNAGTAGDGFDGSLEIVTCNLEKQDHIGPALGNASVVICCIGASEKEVFDITGPYRIDYLAAKNLIDAATVARVNHFILVTSLGTNKIGFPAAILNLFWGVLVWKRKAEEALVASGLPYTIVRPGGMERPTDSYKETHNMTLSREDTLFGGQVSNLQVAELMAFMAKNRKPSYCKIIEVIAETTVPPTPMDELLSRIPSQRADIYMTKESDVADSPDPEAKSVQFEAEKKDDQQVPAASRPLSPFTTYDDLRPPTSPSPSPPGDNKEDVNTTTPTPRLDISNAQTSTSGRSRPLSPYVAYEDLKPPTSPCPIFSGPKESYLASSNTVKEGNDVASTIASGTIQINPSQAMTFNSPYHVYDDLKPPTSPSPSAPYSSSLVNTFAITGDDGATKGAASVDGFTDKQHNVASRWRPLSPFTMYEDMKPPTSPTPSQC